MSVNVILIFVNFITLLWLNIGIVEAIVGGHTANLGTYKYHVSIQNDEGHVCGGTIINDEHILTAASCVMDEKGEFKTNIFTIRGGMVDFNDLNNPGIVAEIFKIYVPKQFSFIRDSFKFFQYFSTGNIAVIKLQHKLDLSPNSILSSVKLPVKNKNGMFAKYFNKRASVVGFGVVKSLEANKQRHGSILGHNSDKKYSNNLKYAYATVLHKNSCKNLFLRPIDDSHICARVDQHYANFAEGVCDGDTGAPLVTADDYIIGILTEFYGDCNEKENSALYTRVSDFLEFINLAIADTPTKEIRVAVYQNKVPPVEGSSVKQQVVEVFHFL